MAKGNSIRGRKMVQVDSTLFTPKITPPRFMSKEGKKIWAKLVETIPNENLCESDFPILEVYCETLASFRIAKKHVQAEGEVIVAESTGNTVVNPWSTVMNNAAGKVTALATKLRLSPSSRMKAEVTHGKPKASKATTPLGALLNG